MSWSFFKASMLAVAASMVVSASPLMGTWGHWYLHKAYKKHDAKPVVWIGDFNNFDDAIALMLVAKDPNYKLKLVVIEESFNAVAPGANVVYDILEWLGNLNVEVIRGAYHGVDEVELGANGLAASAYKQTTLPGFLGFPGGDNSPSEVVDDISAANPSGNGDFQLPFSISSEVAPGDPGTIVRPDISNLERRNVLGINLYGQFVPGPWRDNGATLYNTAHLIPRALQNDYHFSGNRGQSFEFQMAEDIVIEYLEDFKRPGVVLNTGKHTTLARVLKKAKANNPDAIANIEQVVIMGGGFRNRAPFGDDLTADDRDFPDGSLTLGGNIFSHLVFGIWTNFTTSQEFNIFLDPLSAKESLKLLSELEIDTLMVPTNSTDAAKIQADTISSLAERRTTREACYVSKLLTSIREFEGGDLEVDDFAGGTIAAGDSNLNNVIRLWDIMAALVLLEPELISIQEEHYVNVEQLDRAGLLASPNPYDPITFQEPGLGYPAGTNPTSQKGVGETFFDDSGDYTGSKINVVLEIMIEDEMVDGELVQGARSRMVERLRDRFNRARRGPNSCNRRHLHY